MTKFKYFACQDEERGLTNVRLTFDPITNQPMIQFFERSSNDWISMEPVNHSALWKPSLLNTSGDEFISQAIVRSACIKHCDPATMQVHEDNDEEEDEEEKEYDEDFHESFGRVWANAVAVGYDESEEEDIDVVELSMRSAKKSPCVYLYGGQLPNSSEFTNSFKKIWSPNLVGAGGISRDDENDDASDDSFAVENSVADYYISGVNDAKNADELKILAGHRMVSIGHLVYLFGGSSSHGDEFNNELWVYNTRRNTWSKPELKGKIPSPREGHSMTVVKLDYTDKECYRIYIMGGYGEDATTGESLLRNDIYVLNPYTMEFEEVIISPDDYEDEEVILPPTYYHSAVFHKGKIHVLGGYSSNEAEEEYIYQFNTRTQLWEERYLMPDYLPDGISEHTATVVGDYMIVFAGKSRVSDECKSSVYAYSFEPRVWYEVECTCLHSFDRSGHTTVHVGDGRLLVMGGGEHLHSDNDFVIIETGIREKSDLSHIFKKTLLGLQKRNMITDCDIIFGE